MTCLFYAIPMIHSSVSLRNLRRGQLYTKSGSGNFILNLIKVQRDKKTSKDLRAGAGRERRFEEALTASSFLAAKNFIDVLINRADMKRVNLQLVS